MTREEAIKEHREIDKNNKWFNYDLQLLGLIDKIFDDFESRTCENCIHWNVSEESKLDGNGDGFIDCMIIYAESFGSIDYKNFGCNKFERKEK